MKKGKNTNIPPTEAVEIGLNLLKLKESVKHGEFIPRLEVLGHSAFQASKFMRLAKKFDDVSNAGLLTAVETVSQLLELMPLGEHELATLRAGGGVQGITLQSIKDMTVKELRAAIRGVSVVHESAQLSAMEVRVLKAHRENTRNVQDVCDKLTVKAMEAVQ